MAHKKADNTKADNIVRFDRPAVSDRQTISFDRYHVMVEGCMCTVGYAEKLLKLNHKHNRKLNRLGIKKIKTDIVSSRWHLNGSTIIIGKDGKGKDVLLDGQNRLTSVIESGETVPLLIVWGIPEEAWMTLDGAKQRTPADIWRMETGSEPTKSQLITATAAMLLCYDGTTYKGTQEPPRHSRTERHQMALERDDLHRQLNADGAVGKYRNLPCRPALHALECLANKIDPTLAQSYFDRLGTGTNLDANDIIYKLREFLIRERSEKIAYNHLVPIVINAVVRVWNHLRDPQNVKVPTNFTLSRKRTAGRQHTRGYIVAAMK